MHLVSCPQLPHLLYCRYTAACDVLDSLHLLSCLLYQRIADFDVCLISCLLISKGCSSIAGRLSVFCECTFLVICSQSRLLQCQILLFAFRPNGPATLTTICYTGLMPADWNATNTDGSKANAEFMDTQEWPPSLHTPVLMLMLITL